MMGDISEIAVRREEVEDGTGGHVDGYAVRVWIVGPEEGDETLALTILGPRDGPDGDLSRLLSDEPVSSWLELVMGNR